MVAQQVLTLAALPFVRNPLPSNHPSAIAHRSRVLRKQKSATNVVLAAPGPLLTPPSCSSPLRRPVTGPTPPKLRSAMETQLRLRRAAAAAAGGAQEARTGPANTDARRQPWQRLVCVGAFRLRQDIRPRTHQPNDNQSSSERGDDDDVAVFYLFLQKQKNRSQAPYIP